MARSLARVCAVRKKQYRYTTKIIHDADDLLDFVVPEFSELSTVNRRASWLKSLFVDICHLYLTPTATRDLSMVAKLINGLYDKTYDDDIEALIGRMFAATIITLQSVIDETRTIELIRLTSKLLPEIFKFSWIATRLMNSEQNTLLRHRLKKTKYELRKYNLLHEHVGGFSQLLSLFYSMYNDQDNTQKAQYYAKQAELIIGKYSLDAFKSLHLLWQISIEYITCHHNFLIEFLKASAFWPVPGKLSNCDTLTNLNKGGNYFAAKSFTFILNKCPLNDRPILLDMCSLLIKCGFFNFYSIWDNIEIEASLMKEMLTQYDCILEEESTKGVENALAMASALANDEVDQESPVVSESIDQSGEEQNATQCSKPMKDELSLDGIRDRIIGSSKYILLRRLLANGCTLPAIHVLSEYPSLICVDEILAKLFARCFEYQIEPLYRESANFMTFSDTTSAPINRIENGMLNKQTRIFIQEMSHEPFESEDMRVNYQYYNTGWSDDLKQITTIHELFEETHKLWSVVGCMLGKTPQLIIKLCRIGLFDIERKVDDDQVISKWINYVRKFIIPSLALLEVNPIATGEFYKLLEHFPSDKRYYMYHEMIMRKSQEELLVKIGFNKFEREVKGIIKALSTDTLEKESRNLAALISTNPLATLTATLKQIENYDKVSELVIFTTRYFNKFAYDVLQFVILTRLTLNRSAVQFDGVNQAMWVQRLAIFIAGLVESSPKMDITNIITFIVKSLHTGNIVALTILKELVSKVGGIRDLVDVSTKRIVMLNSGKPLQEEARKLVYDLRDENLERGYSLVSKLASQNAISEIIVLLYQMNTTIGDINAHYKILSSRYDEMNTMLWSYIELVKNSLPLAEFTKNVLPFQVLINKFDLSSAWAFHIWRENIDKNLVSEQSNDIEHLLSKIDFKGVNFDLLPRVLYTTFWRLSLYDVYYEAELYEEMKNTLEDEDTTKYSTRRKNLLTSRIREVMAASIRHRHTHNKTIDELRKCNSNCSKKYTVATFENFWQHCLMPRIIFSPADALYCSYFLSLTFQEDAFFSICDLLITSNSIGNLLFSSTIFEAGNIGIFFNSIVEAIDSMRLCHEKRSLTNRQIYEWHSELLGQLIELLSNKNYMSVRNGIEFMKHVTNNFPSIDHHIKCLCEALESNLASENREDIKLPTNALLGHLKARLKKAITLDDFCDLNEEENLIKSTYVEECELIKKHEFALENEKKQADLKRKLELNKLKRSEKVIATDEDTKPGHFLQDNKILETENSNQHWSMSDIFNAIENVAYNLKYNHLSEAIDILDFKRRDRAHEALHKCKSVTEKRTKILEVFEDYFSSLIYNANNPEFKKKLASLSNACRFTSMEITSSRHTSPNGQYPSRVASDYDNQRSTSRYNNPKISSDSYRAELKGNTRHLGRFTNSIKPAQNESKIRDQSDNSNYGARNPPKHYEKSTPKLSENFKMKQPLIPHSRLNSDKRTFQSQEFDNSGNSYPNKRYRKFDNGSSADDVSNASDFNSTKPNQRKAEINLTPPEMNNKYRNSNYKKKYSDKDHDRSRFNSKYTQEQKPETKLGQLPRGPRTSRYQK